MGKKKTEAEKPVKVVVEEPKVPEGAAVVETNTSIDLNDPRTRSDR